MQSAPSFRSAAHFCSAFAAGLALSCLHPPAYATGYLDTNNLSNQCSTPTSLGCVEVGSASTFTLFGSENLQNSQSTTGFSPQPFTYTASFSWTFNNESGMTAFYSINGNQTFLGSSGTTFFDVLAGETLAFGVDTGSSYSPPILEVSNFDTVGDTVGVPAPLPALGAAAAFGAIRRRRAALRLRQASAARAASRHQ